MNSVWVPYREEEEEEEEEESGEKNEETSETSEGKKKKCFQHETVKLRVDDIFFHTK